MKKFILLVLMSLILAACATTAPLWGSGRMSLKKGMTANNVLEILGEPYRKEVDSNNNEIWQYIKPAESRATMNKLAAIGSMGIVSGDNCAMSDVLNIRFHNNKVVNYTYKEAVMTVFSGTDNISVNVNTNSVQTTTNGEAATVSIRSDSASVAPTKVNLSVTSGDTSIAVIRNNANLRKSPSKHAAILKKLSKGATVTIIKQKDDWLMVEDATREVGWCHKSVLSQ